MRPTLGFLTLLFGAMLGSFWGAIFLPGLLIVTGQLGVGGMCGTPHASAAMLGMVLGGPVGLGVSTWLLRSWRREALALAGLAGWLRPLRKLGVGVALLAVAQGVFFVQATELARLATRKEALTNLSNIAIELERRVEEGLGYHDGAGSCPGGSSYASNDTIPGLGLALHGWRYDYRIEATRTGASGHCDAYRITATGIATEGAKGMVLTLDSDGRKSGPWP